MVKLIDKLAGAVYFMSLNQISRSYQMYLHPDDKQKCTFNAHSGHFQCKRVAFGLRCAPSSFQCLMQTVLAWLQPFKNVSYIDDIIVTSCTFEEYLERFVMVFDKLTFV